MLSCLERLKLPIKFKKSKLNANLILAISLLFSCFPIFSTTNFNLNQKIYIESDIQSLDFQKNVITFTGHVVITQGKIIINADKVVIVRADKKQDQEIINGYGNPVTFYHDQDNGKKIKGRAREIYFNLVKNLIILNGNAYLEQDSNSISGKKITYLVKEHIMQAFSEKGKSVTAVITQSKFQDK